MKESVLLYKVVTVYCGGKGEGKEYLAEYKTADVSDLSIGTVDALLKDGSFDHRIGWNVYSTRYFPSDKTANQFVKQFLEENL